MKNLLLLLLLANLLYLLWWLFDEPTPQPGVAIISEADFGPPLEIVPGSESIGVASVGAILGSGDASDLEAVVGRSCVSIGPFMDEEEASTAQDFYSGEDLLTNAREVEEEVFVGHWVQIRNVEDEAAGGSILDSLADGGLDEAYLVRTEEEGLKISLGVFDDVEGAEKIELEARSLGFAADISPRMAERPVRYVDIALPPGMGAGLIVERYGEDRVRLRDEATCP